MVKNNKKDNTLIKINKLREFLKTRKVKRISEEALYLIDQHVKNYLSSLSQQFHEHLITNGKKNLSSKDIKIILKASKQNSPDNPET